MEPLSITENRSKTNGQADVAVFLKSLVKAKKDLSLYPPTNPVVTESVNNLIHLLKETFVSWGTIEILVGKEGLFVNGADATRACSGAEDFCLLLYKRGLRRLTLNVKISRDEMRGLLEILNMKVEDIAGRGGIEKLMRELGITSAYAEGASELTIIDAAGLEADADFLGDLKGLNEGEVEQLRSPESFSRTFIRAAEGDVATLKRLKSILGNPQLLSKLLEKFAIQIRTSDRQQDPAKRVENLLKILRSIGTAIVAVPSQDERLRYMQNLAISVLGLSAEVRKELVIHGLVPNLVLTRVESDILSRFPVSDLASALLQNFVVSGVVSVMQSYFRNLDFAQVDRLALVDALRAGLAENGMLDAETDSFLSEEETPAEAPTARGEDADDVSGESVPEIEGYPAEKILFRKGERIASLRSLVEEFEAPIEDVMLIPLLELMRHEEVPANHKELVAQAKSYMAHFLEKEDYENAALLIRGLQAEWKEKKRFFSQAQIDPLKAAIDEFLSEENIRKLIDKFREINKEHPCFEKLVRYFDTLGGPAIRALIQALEDEESRHVRLLICEAVAMIGDKSMPEVIRIIDHPTWYVVRNAISILGQTGRPDSVPSLRKALAHSDIRVRREVLKALASIRSGEAIEVLCSSLREDDMEMCRAALGWIATIETERAAPAVKRLLEGRKIWKRDIDFLKRAIEILGNGPPEEVTDFLRGLAQTKSFFRRKKASTIRSAAHAALRRMTGE